MIPVQFGSGGGPLLGLYSPSSGRRLRKGAVLANPFGQEALRAHRSLRLLAVELSTAGFDVLRFDYSGTGDSWGEGRDIDLDRWTGDLELAVEELVALSGVRSVTLVGLRLGALLCAEVAGRRRRVVNGLVLWDPPANGSAILPPVPQGGLGSGDLEVDGFWLPASFAARLVTLDFKGRPGEHCRALCIRSNPEFPDPSGVLLASTVDSRVVESPPAWQEERTFGAGAVPVELLRTIAAWVR